MRQGRFNVRS